jgi:hypothetical protein
MEDFVERAPAARDRTARFLDAAELSGALEAHLCVGQYPTARHVATFPPRSSRRLRARRAARLAGDGGPRGAGRGATVGCGRLEAALAQVRKRDLGVACVELERAVTLDPQTAPICTTSGGSAGEGEGPRTRRTEGQGQGEGTVMDVTRQRGQLQGLLVLMGSLSHGLETVLGRGAATVTFRAGRTVGLKADVRERTADVERALVLVGEELRAVGIVWPFELWKPAAASSFFYDKDGKQTARLVFPELHGAKLALPLRPRAAAVALPDEPRPVLRLPAEDPGGKRVVRPRDLNAGENACLKELIVHE